jgi:hypothetical protein
MDRRTLSTGQLHRRFQVVHNPAIFGIRNFRNAKPVFLSTTSAQRQPSRVMHLAAASGIERSFAQDDGGAWLLGRGRG